MTAVGEAIEQSCRHLGIPKDSSPFTEAEVGGGDDDAGALVEFAVFGRAKLRPRR